MLVSSKEVFRIYCQHTGLSGKWIQYGMPVKNPADLEPQYNAMLRVYPGKRYKIERTKTVIEEIDIKTFNK